MKEIKEERDRLKALSELAAERERTKTYEDINGITLDRAAGKATEKMKHKEESVVERTARLYKKLGVVPITEDDVRRLAREEIRMTRVGHNLNKEGVMKYV